MQGYFEDPAATKETVDPDGWLHTGDVGVIGDDGNLRVLDRIKDIVIVGGFNVYPAEVENVLRHHPSVADAAVFGMPDARQGEVCAAAIIPQKDCTPTPEELIAWSRERMANFKVPRQVRVMKTFPRTPLGKVQKLVLREIFAAG